MPAAIGNIFANDVGADERHEEHQDAAEADGHSRDVSPLRNGAAAARSVTARATGTVIRAAGRRAATPTAWRSNFYLDIVCDDAWHFGFRCCLFPLASHFLRRQILRHEVFLHAGNAEVVRPAIDAGEMAAEIIVRRRRIGDPFERRGVPWIL